MTFVHFITFSFTIKGRVKRLLTPHFSFHHSRLCVRKNYRNLFGTAPSYWKFNFRCSTNIIATGTVKVNLFLYLLLFHCLFKSFFTVCIFNLVSPLFYLNLHCLRQHGNGVRVVLNNYGKKNIYFFSQKFCCNCKPF